MLMIKTDRQLDRTKELLRETELLVDTLDERYEGAQLDTLRESIERQIAEFRTEIDEYRILRQASLDEALSESLIAPTLVGNVGELLAKLRISSGFTQSELAEHLGWRQPNLSRFESEENNSKTTQKITEYASGLGVYLHVSPSFSETVSANVLIHSTKERDMGKPLIGLAPTSDSISSDIGDDTSFGVFVIPISKDIEFAYQKE